MTEPLVHIRGLTKVYQRGQQRIEVLHGIDLDIPEGDFVALMGPSGSGKTTLLNLIGGLDSPTGGVLRVEGDRIDAHTSDELAAWRASTIGFIFQSYNLMHLLRNSVELYGSLEQETGRAVDFHRCGSVRIGTTRDRLHQFEHVRGIAENVGVPFEIVSPERALELFPLARSDGVLAAAAGWTSAAVRLRNCSSSTRCCSASCRSRC